MNDIPIKRCRVCGEDKPTTDFYQVARGIHGVGATCKACKAQYNASRREHRNQVHREWRAKHPSHEYHGKLRRDYGLTPTDYLDLLTQCASGCMICGVHLSEDRLCIDHDHVTGQVRGLLCARHNAAIGMFGDDPLLLQRATHYLQRCTTDG